MAASTITVPSRRSFAVAAHDYCRYSHSGGHLLSFSSLSPSPNGMLAALRSLVAPAGTPLVLTGGFQGGRTGPSFPKFSNWAWANGGTDAAILNYAPKDSRSNWGPGQPDDRNSTSTREPPQYEAGAANALAISRDTVQFFDVGVAEVMDVVCMYRAPAPCPPGFRLYVDDGTEHFMSSCVRVYPPATLSVARDTCASAWPEARQSGAKYQHLATYSALSCSQPSAVPPLRPAC